jgi:hypothetical protein
MPATHNRTALDRFVRDPRSGRVVLAQWPNAPLIAWGVLTVGAALAPAHAQQLRWAAVGALVAWSGDELVRGASPARRVLGLGVLAALVYRLVRG